MLVGAALGAAVALYLRFVKRELVLFAIVVAFFGMVIARLGARRDAAHAAHRRDSSPRTLAARGRRGARHAMERSAAPVFVVFFALAGAEIALREVAAVWPLLLPIVAVRIGAIWAGDARRRALGRRAGRRTPGLDGARLAGGRGDRPRDRDRAGLSVRGAQMQTLFLAVVAINQVIGPISSALP